MSVPDEHILVVPTLLFHEIGVFQGFSRQIEPYFSTLLDAQHTSYRPRAEMEEDPSFKQLIPYCLFRHDGRLFHYQRGTGQGEGRLHHKRSVGVGGHISREDATADEPAYLIGMRREIEEEVAVDLPSDLEFVGLINDDSTPVGQVHLGLVHLIDLNEPKVAPREESIQNTGFAQPADLMNQLDEFETWSQIALTALFGEQ